MKLACFGEICAPPMRCPFRPAASTSRPGLVARGILEDTAETPDPIRLRSLALGLDRIGSLANERRRIGMHTQTSTDHHVIAQVVLESRVAVAEPALGDLQRHRLPSGVERGALDEHIDHLGPEGAGVAVHARAARPGHADAELESRDAARCAVERHTRHHRAAAELDAVLVDDAKARSS